MRQSRAEIKRADKLFDRMELAIALFTYARDEMEPGEKRDHIITLSKVLTCKTDAATPLARKVARMNISTLADTLGIPYRKLVRIYQEHKRLEGIIRVSQMAPAVLEGIAEDAMPQETTCAACEGTGRIAIARDEEGVPTDTRMCIPCDGKGYVRKPGDPIARKQVLEIMELTGPKAAPIVPISGSNVIVTGGTLEDTLRAARGGASGQVTGFPEGTGDRTLSGQADDARDASTLLGDTPERSE